MSRATLTASQAEALMQGLRDTLESLRQARLRLEELLEGLDSEGA